MNTFGTIIAVVLILCVVALAVAGTTWCVAMILRNLKR